MQCAGVFGSAPRTGSQSYGFGKGSSPPAIFGTFVIAGYSRFGSMAIGLPCVLFKPEPKRQYG